MKLIFPLLRHPLKTSHRSGQAPITVNFGVARCVLGLLVAIVFATGGCLSRPHLRTQSFSFTVLPLKSTPLRSPGGTLTIRHLSVASPYADQSFVYRTGDLTYERDPYAGFLVPPAEELAEPLRSYFRESGAFQQVLEPGSALEPDTLVEIAVEQLYGDFRPGMPPASVLEIRFSFLKTSRGIAGALLLDKQYSRRVHLKSRTASAVMGGWNTALADILAEVGKDLNSSYNRPKAEASVAR